MYERLGSEGDQQVGKSLLEEHRNAILDIKKSGNERPDVNLTWNQFTENWKKVERYHLNFVKPEKRK